MGSQRIIYDRQLDGVRVFARRISNDNGESFYRIEGTLDGHPVRVETVNTRIPTRAVVAQSRALFSELYVEASRSI